MKEKLIPFIKHIFGAGQILLMMCALVIICAYVFAFIVGGSTAIAIEAFIYGKIFPKLYLAAVILAFIGVIYLYLTGHHSMRFETNRKNS